ncbi:hypothetical protein DPEC_G00177700 [Dallia pectoralis]|uniref:Uncharacterized protein n=1 Tax=Dallia pectoralis TaxID=75939 RepID=A0ACC2GFC7_DALPE|nr:hypothetical protein DPEC_G00177700 [Dallia pectoralis]
MGPTWPQSSPQKGRDGPVNVGQHRWDSTGRPICLECAAARGAWDKAFAVWRRIEASEGIPQGEFCDTARLARQSTVRLPPETEMVVWAQVPRASGIPECYVIVVDLGDSAQGYRVARTLCHLKGDWRAVFAMEEDNVGYTIAVRHQILTGDAPPTRERYRPIPPSLSPEIWVLLQTTCTIYDRSLKSCTSRV